MKLEPWETASPPEKVIDITGPEGESLLWETKSWLVSGRLDGFQKRLDETWYHYRDVADERLLALVGALCVENAVDKAIAAFAPGFSSLVGDHDFTFSVKVKMLRSLKVLPSRVLTACDLVREIRNKFAHNLELKSLADLGPKHLKGLHAQTEAFNPAGRDKSEHARQFRDIVGFIIMALMIYETQLGSLREFVSLEEFRSAFKAWSEQR